MPGYDINNAGIFQNRHVRPSSLPTYRPLEYPVPPTYPESIENQLYANNPAIREVIQSQEPERHRHRGSRRAYIVTDEMPAGMYLDKHQLLNYLNTIRPYKQQAVQQTFGRGINNRRADGTFYNTPEERERFQRIYEEELEKAKKETERQEFNLLHQYRLSKNDSPLQNPNGLLTFGGPGGEVSKFINGFEPNIKGWKNMSPAEKDDFIARENELRNTPERIARRERGRANALLAQGLQASRQQAEEETRRLNALSPIEREKRNYNREVQNYMNQQNAAEHKNQAQFIQRNKEMQQGQNLGQNMPVPLPVMNELIAMINSRPTRYVPIRNRPSLNDRVMSSFDENMFNPEFLTEEE